MILPDLDAGCMLPSPRVAAFPQVNVVIVIRKIRITVMQVSHSGVIILTITA
jgi:hypothetical protein